ncbi:alpha-E domain-containing protein [Balneatrix alpica]|uniref:Alpha-E domain-containing protein n=1 Tax=Balneatrix alpica TaxID=75684 RepID=A0ABV5ZEF9_9GAMM|nr:alpha-E domain-containing protein [Balneatrix alpica]
MLSTVAERIYWSARYLERVENTARLVSVYDNLLFDLPRDINISWFNLVTINSGEDLFNERYKVRDERNVVKFTLADDTNPSSMLSSLKMIRENIRTTRDVVPQDTWELINELDLYANNNINYGINRSQRHVYLDEVIKGCQQINGLLSGEMSRDAAWQFVMLGRNLERADMTTRILDAGASILMQPNEGNSTNLAQVIWGNVLRSLSGYLNYRRAVRTSVRGNQVAHYLLEDPHFPRTLQFCTEMMRQATLKLPHGEEVLPELKKLAASRYAVDEQLDFGADFHDYLNDLQLQLADLHSCITRTWFNFDSRNGGGKA